MSYRLSVIEREIKSLKAGSNEDHEKRIKALEDALEDIREMYSKMKDVLGQ